jgi:hypothetical protein
MCIVHSGAHIRGGGGGGDVTPPMFCEIYLKSRSQKLNGTKRSVRLKSESERYYHFVSKKVIGGHSGNGSEVV